MNEVKRSAEQESNLQITEHDPKKFRENSLLLAVLPVLKDLPKTISELAFGYNPIDIRNLILNMPFQTPLRVFSGSYVPNPIFGPINEVMTASLLESAKLWDLEGNKLAEFQEYEIIQAAQVHHTQRSLLLVKKHHVEIRNFHGNLQTSVNHGGLANLAVFNAAGDRILTASRDFTARLWDMQGNQLSQFDHDTGVVCALFHPSQNMVLTVTPTCAYLLDLQGNELRIFNCNRTMRWAIFNPQGNILVTATRNNNGIGGIYIWNVTDGTNIGHAHVKGVIKSVVFNHSGDRILVAADNSAYLYDVHAKEIKRLVHKANINSAAFNQTGEIILTSCDDKIAYLWDLHGDELARFDHKKRVACAFFNSGGNKIITLADKISVFDISFIKTSYDVDEDQVILLLLLDAQKRKKISKISLKKIAKENKIDVAKLRSVLRKFSAPVRDHLIRSYGIIDSVHDVVEPKTNKLLVLGALGALGAGLAAGLSYYFSQ
jgi:WD40 repeat protein